MTEQSVSDTEPFTPQPGAGAPSDHPLVKPPVVSIVDNILDLDELMSADVRRAEKTARFALKAYLEADIDELEAELESLSDELGNPLNNKDRAVAETDKDGQPRRTALDVAMEIQTLRAEYGASFKSVRMRQVPDDDWDAFRTKWKKALDEGSPYPREFWNELIAMSAHQPKIPVETVRAMRKKLGHPPMDVLGTTAWDVNVNSGVDIPKSQRSSLVLKRAQRTTS
jgi:hypothetical protein